MTTCIATNATYLDIESDLENLVSLSRLNEIQHFNAFGALAHDENGACTEAPDAELLDLSRYTSTQLAIEIKKFAERLRRG